ncbi:hypothetical protein MRBBS_2834 [Marinobacter sp. BSs20148]|jgi:hypothetical protein|nr:hypothetical protein MRBBS_2834 [Marinobacter sp. BSs20148]
MLNELQLRIQFGTDLIRAERQHWFNVGLKAHKSKIAGQEKRG